jgi:MSHA biogenesis protein MshJ
MAARFNSLFNYLNNLSLREKLLLLTVFISVLFSLWDSFYFANYSEKKQQNQSDQQQFSMELQQLEADISKAEYDLKNNIDPNQELHSSINKNKQQLEVTHQQLEAKLSGLVSPTKITTLLRNILLKSQDLQLLTLNNEPVEVMDLQPSSNNEPDTETPTLLYLHATTIKLSGSYLQLHQYLEALENSPWGLFWDQLEYTVTDYPTAEIILRVHTVSTDKHWIGL